MEASALRHPSSLPHLAGHSPLLRLQGDEKLVALIRRGHSGAFDALVQRYQPRLLAFCRHMLNSQEDAEDVLQEVFAASFNALLADERPINARPWLYRIARNRCLNHLRRPRATGQDSMDFFENDHGASTAETVHRREEFRQIVADVQELPETQRTALLLREIDALSYDQIAEAMDTTIPSVKSLLVRARVGLAEASQARLLTCEEVRLELGEVAEGLSKTTAPARRHLKSCERCRTFRSELRATSKALAAVFPIGPFVLLKKLGILKLGFGGGAAAGGTAGTAGGGIAASGAGLAAGGAATAASSAAGGAISAGLGTLASKAAAGMAAAVIVTAGAVEVKQVAKRAPTPAPVTAVAPHQPTAAAASSAERAAARKAAAAERDRAAQRNAAIASAKREMQQAAEKKAAPTLVPAVPTPPPAATTPDPAPPPAPAPATPAPTQEDGGTTTLPPRTTPVPPPLTPGNGTDSPAEATPPPQQEQAPQRPPAESSSQSPPQSQPRQLTAPLP
ncbi:MAG: RNA polymerase sigma factor [Thermoleophilaceae bacterium]